ncbi:ParB/RepB/Spo0J family partition protein [Haloactinopolyspora sp.]|uniref:ParB/RepB/Spo0J family partition protein n=1 Tax=Haloactinopolyspora sp. TaxID=1966353 RepID=UPI00261EE4C9|nr:ParB/RepB/Spo0J family partition protein [Haloactinopolyspora sp.]
MTLDARTVPIESLVPSDDNPRSDLGDLGGLADSIATIGITSPLLVRELPDGKLGLIAGHRRLAAAARADLPMVPVIVESNLDETERLTMQLVDNLHREDLAPLDRAAAFQQLIDLGKTQAEVAKLTGVSQPTVSKALALLDLPEKAKTFVDRGLITQTDALALASLPEEQRDDVVAELPDIEDEDGEPVPDEEIEDFDLSWKIRREQAKALDRERTAQAIEEAKAAGVAVLTFDEYTALGTAVRLSALPWLTPKERKAHADATCRALGVQGDGRGTFEICLAPATHERPEPKGAKEQGAPKVTAEEERERQLRFRHWDELDLATERRRTWLADLKAKPGELALATAALQTVIGEIGTDEDIQLVCTLLGIDPAGMDHAAAADAIVARATAKEIDAHRAAFFLALARFEAIFTMSRYDLDDAIVAEYYRLEVDLYLTRLQALGYEPTTAERRYVGWPFEEDEDANADLDDPVDEIGPEPVIHLRQQGKRWLRMCSVCGKLDGFNTNESDARERGDVHLAEEHGIDVRASA